jgi:hypothetical protein
MRFELECNGIAVQVIPVSVDWTQEPGSRFVLRPIALDICGGFLGRLELGGFEEGFGSVADAADGVRGG